MALLIGSDNHSKKENLPLRRKKMEKTTKEIIAKLQDTQDPVEFIKIWHYDAEIAQVSEIVQVPEIVEKYLKMVELVGGRIEYRKLVKNLGTV
jgi:hypothetical protein